jgi:2-polyprenyl-3-methyl-5-hydroxy-6-metoxy-1,4-benzoquinol methylase
VPQSSADDRRDFYLRKEQITACDAERMSMAFWENSRSFRFVAGMKKYLRSPVADFGCGPGPLSLLTARMGFDITGYDCVAENVANARALTLPTDQAQFVQTFLDHIPVDDNVYHSGLLKEVLEHIVVPDIPVVLREIRRTLAPGAHLIVTVPRESLLSRNPSSQHVTFFGSPRVLAEVLKRNGFEVVRREYNRLYRRIAVVARVPREKSV